jgi:hypothetical protein
MVHYSYPSKFLNPINARIIDKTNVNYPYPVHNDEWNHLAQSIQIIEKKRIEGTVPYFKDKIEFRDLESGFHIFLSEIFVLTGLNPVLGYQYLSSLFMVINSLALFVFVRRLTKNFWISLLSILFFASLGNNVNMLGTWFFTPLTFSIFLIYSFFVFLYEYFENHDRQYLACLLIIYFASVVVYPPSTMLITMILIPYLFFNYRQIRKDWKHFKISLILIIFLIIIGGFYIQQVSFETVLEKLIFLHGWTAQEFTYPVHEFYGLIATSLAIIGFVFVITKKLNKILLIWPIIFVIEILSYDFLKYTVLIPYQRSFFYLLLGLSPLSAIGLYHLLNIFNLRFRRIVKNRNFALSIDILIIALIMITVFHGYYEIEPKRFSLQYILSEEKYNAIKWLGDKYGEGNVVLSDPFTSVTIYPIIRNKVVGFMTANVWGREKKLLKFFRGNDKDKLETLRNEGVDFVITDSLLRLENLKLIYDKRPYIYEVIDRNQ